MVIFGFKVPRCVSVPTMRVVPVPCHCSSLQPLIGAAIARVREESAGGASRV